MFKEGVNSCGMMVEVCATFLYSKRYVKKNIHEANSVRRASRGGPARRRTNLAAESQRKGGDDDAVQTPVTEWISNPAASPFTELSQNNTVTFVSQSALSSSVIPSILQKCAHIQQAA